MFCIRTAFSLLDCSANLSNSTGNNAEHHPPFRPLAPKPATFESKIAILIFGDFFHK